MHELSIMRQIFVIIEETAVENNLTKLNCIRLDIGELRQIIPESFQFAFRTLAAGTVAEGADLLIRWIPVRLACRDCGWEGESGLPFVCGGCGGARTEILGGRDIMLTSIEGERYGN